MSDVRKLLARNIKRFRGDKGWTQTDLAVASGISFRGVQNIEVGKRTPRPETLAALAGALGVTEAQLFADPNLEQSPDMVNVLDIGQLAKQLSSELHKISPQSQNEELNDQEKDLITFFRRLPSAKLKKVALEFVRDLTDLDPLPNETQMPALRRRLR